MGKMYALNKGSSCTEAFLICCVFLILVLFLKMKNSHCLRILITKKKEDALFICAQNRTIRYRFEGYVIVMREKRTQNKEDFFFLI